MRIFVIFSVLFSAVVTATSAGWMRSRRTWRQKNANDLLAVADRTSGFQDFHGLLDENLHDERSVFRKHRSRRSVALDVHEAHKLVLFFNVVFMDVSFVYFVQYMIEYYLLTRRYPNGLLGGGGRGFCMVTAWYDIGIVTDDGLESVLCSLFLVPRGRAATDDDSGDSLWQLSTLSKRKNEYAKNAVVPVLPEHSLRWRRRRRPHGNLSLPELERVLLGFPEAFCARWKPLAGDILFANPGTGIPYSKSARFVRHVLEKEKCVVNLELHGYTSWKCYGILDSREYGSDKCEEDEIKRPGYSLVELENKIIKDYGDYKNAVNYYNIVSEVVLFVSIREGSNILKAIKHVVTKSCAGNDMAAVDGIFALRSALFAFKSVFDRLVAAMSDEKRIDVGRNPYKTKFDGLVSSVLKLLRVRTDDDGGMSISKMCTEVRDALNGGKYELNSDAHNTVKFHEYYTTLPILHVNQLYRFYAYDFV